VNLGFLGFRLTFIISLNVIDKKFYKYVIN